MHCPRCGSAKTNQSGHKPAFGYRTFRCSDGQPRFNERTATPFTNLPFPTAIVLLVVLWSLRFKLRVPDRAALCLERGCAFAHEPVRDWVARFAPRITQQLRATRQGKGGWLLARRRNLFAHRRQMALPIARHKPRGPPGRLHDEEVQQPHDELGKQQIAHNLRYCMSWPSRLEA
jgi:hypothetical protein